jgi:hypothetical protein
MAACLGLMASRAAAQISPPGLGEATTALWTALGLRQELDRARRWESMTYLGVGRISRPDGYDPLQRQAIGVLNQEFYHRPREHLLYSFALSYRRQAEYASSPPYERASPAATNELRLYGRVSHVQKVGPFKLVNTFRPELRTFFPSSPAPEEEFLQLRFRARSQLTWALDREAVHRLVASGEALASIRKTHRPEAWSDFGYRESRFCFYYSLHPQALPFSIDLGYMNDLLGSRQPLRDVHYAAFDLVWENPFGRRAR